MTVLNQIGNYEELLSLFIKHDYTFVKFDKHRKLNNEIILRHDVDISISKAYEMSLVEDNLSISSTYFIMLSNPLYNCLDKENYMMISDMIARGHTISLHFDPRCYLDIEKGFKKEKEVFETIFNVSVDIISFHRPVDKYLNCVEQFYGVNHSYQSKFFSEIGYISDSGGDFLYGHPLKSEAFLRKKSIQLLIHPIWWIQADPDLIKTLDNIVDCILISNKEYISNNVKKYKIK